MRAHHRQTFLRGRRALSLALLALLGAAQAAAARQAAPGLRWREFTSEAGGFSVKLPGAPRVSRPRVVLGPFTLSPHVHEVTAGGYSFAVDYAELPAGANPEYVREAAVRGMVNETLAERGRVVVDGRVASGACEGREASISAPPRRGASGFKHLRVFSSGQRFYMLLFTAGEDRPEARETARLFMDSFVVDGGCSPSTATGALPAAAPVRSTVEGTPDAATGWRRIESAEHGFSVLMPGAALRTSRESRVQNFPLFLHDYVYESDGVTYSAKLQGDFPEGVYDDETSLEDQLDLSIYILKKNLGSRGLSFGEARRFKVGALPAREYVMTNERAEERGRARLYATPRRAYVFIALGRDTRPAGAADLERFFSSIKVSPK